MAVGGCGWPWVAVGGRGWPWVALYSITLNIALLINQGLLYTGRSTQVDVFKFYTDEFDKM